MTWALHRRLSYLGFIGCFHSDNRSSAQISKNFINFGAAVNTRCRSYSVPKIDCPFSFIWYICRFRPKNKNVQHRPLSSFETTAAFCEKIDFFGTHGQVTLTWAALVQSWATFGRKSSAFIQRSAVYHFGIGHFRPYSNILHGPY